MVDIGRACTHHTRRATAATSAAHARILLELLVYVDLVASVSRLARISVGGAFFANDRDLVTIHGTTGSPLVVAAGCPDTVPCLVQIVNERSLIVLTSNDTFLGTCHTWCNQASSWSSMLRRPILVIGKACQSECFGSRPLGVRIQRLVLVVLRMEQQRFQAKRFALESTVLNVVVRWSVVHQVFDGGLRLVTV